MSLSILPRPGCQQLQVIRLNVFGEVDVGLRVARMFTTRTVVIAELGDIEGILGLDYLEDNKAIFDIVEGCLYTRNGDIKLHRENLGDLVVCFREDVVIPPNSEMCILGTVGSAGLAIDRHGSSWILEPNTSLQDGSPLVIGRSLVDVSRGDLPMVVINTSCEDVTLKQGSIVGNVQPVVKISAPNKQYYQICSAKADMSDGIESETVNNLPEHLQDLVDRASGEMSSSEYQILTNLISSYSDIFASPNGELGRTDRIKHTIDTGDARPIRQAPRRLSPCRRELVEQEIDKMLAQGIIETSDSPWAAPIVLVSKKDGTTRFCVDYRKLVGQNRGGTWK